MLPNKENDYETYRSVPHGARHNLGSISSPPDAFGQKDKKPGGGGGGGGGGGSETPAGSIYYYHGTVFDVVQMKADGTEKTPLLIGPGVQNPSHATYNGKRYFLDSSVQSIIAVPDDGTEPVVLLEPNSDGDWVKTNGRVEWVNVDLSLDVKISWFAHNATLGVSAVRRAPIVLDEDGNVSGLDLNNVESYEGITGDYHWSPDGDELVYSLEGWLFTYDTQSEEHQPLFVDQATNPVWSPDGERIAYKYRDGVDTSIEMVTLATGVRTMIVSARSGMQAYSPQWSPTGSHLTYVRTTHKGFERSYHIWRCTKDGQDHVDLTPDYKNNIWGAHPLGWRLDPLTD
jgi:Tol biopolymer transport system component